MLVAWSRIKTTVEVPDALFREAKEYATRHGIPFRELVTRGLQTILHASRPPQRRFRLKTVTTKGEGLVCGGDWSTIRSHIYQSHGG